MARRPTSTIVFDENVAGMGFASEDSPKPRKISPRFLTNNKPRVEALPISDANTIYKIQDIQNLMYRDLDSFMRDRSVDKFNTTIQKQLEKIKKLQESEQVVTLKEKILKELEKVHKIYPIKYVEVDRQHYWRIKAPKITVTNENVSVEYDSIYLYLSVRDNQTQIFAKTPKYHPHIHTKDRITEICFGDLKKNYLKAKKDLEFLAPVEMAITVLSSYNPGSAYFTLEYVAGWPNCYSCGDCFDAKKLSGRYCALCDARYNPKPKVTASTVVTPTTAVATYNSADVTSTTF